MCLASLPFCSRLRSAGGEFVALVAVSVLTLTSHSIVAEEYTDYLDERVVVTEWDAQFRLPEGIVGSAELGNVYVVEKVNGPWLWVTSAGGWIHGKHVVKFDKAEAYFTEQVAAKPSSETHFNRGMARLRMDQVDRAMEDFEAAIKLGVSPTYFNARGIAWLRKGAIDKSIQDHTEALRIDPKFSAAYYNRGNARFAQKKYDQAIADYNLALQLNPKNGRGFVNRGQCWHQKREYEKAVADYDVACEMNPRWPLAFNNRADALNRLREFDRAIADCDLAIKYDPKFTWALTNRGNAYMGKEQVDKALADYDAALAIDEDFAPAYHNRGNLRASQGDWVAAMKDYQRAIEADEDFAAPHNGWAWLLATCAEPGLRDPKQAVTLAERACRLNRDEWNHFGTLAAAYAGLSDWKRAVKAQKQAIAMLPTTASADDRAGANERLKLYESETAFFEQ